jgi:hypothetical protein
MTLRSDAASRDARRSPAWSTSRAYRSTMGTPVRALCHEHGVALVDGLEERDGAGLWAVEGLDGSPKGVADRPLGDDAD